MAIYNNSVQTDKGRALETRSRNGEGAIEFVCIKTGAGIYSGDERLRLREMTELKEMKQEFRFSGIKPEKEYDYLSLESVIKNEGIEEGYYFTEVGIYARIRGEEENVLYCIGLVDEPDYIPPHTNGKTYEIVLQSLIKCYDAEHVTIEYMDTVYATAESLMEHVSDKNNPHDTTKAQVGLGNADNTADADKPGSGPQQAALDAYYAQSTGYADQKVADLINGAPSNQVFSVLKPTLADVRAAKTFAAALGGKVLNVVQVQASVQGFETARVNFYLKGVTAGQNIKVFQVINGQLLELEVAEIRADHVVVDMTALGTLAFIEAPNK